MSSDFEIQLRKEYLHIIHAPDYKITSEGMEKFWTELTEACEIHECRRVLSEGKISIRRMKTSDAYHSGMQASMIPNLRLAFLFYDYTTDETTEFFKTVASNRGTSIEFFTDKTKALEWLGVKNSDK
jgi:hypothetical protein